MKTVSIATNPQKTSKSTSAIAKFFDGEELWQELADPSEATQTQEETEDHDEWDDRKNEEEPNH